MQILAGPNDQALVRWALHLCRCFHLFHGKRRQRDLFSAENIRHRALGRVWRSWTFAEWRLPNFITKGPDLKNLKYHPTAADFVISLLRYFLHLKGPDFPARPSRARGTHFPLFHENKVFL